MESLSIIKLLEFGSQFGLLGLILILWWLDERSRSRMFHQNRKDIQKTLDAYQNDMRDIRRMYESNVKLVEGYEDLAQDLKDIVILNTRAMTQLSDDVRNNQYCPQVRLDKRAKGAQG